MTGSVQTDTSKAFRLSVLALAVCLVLLGTLGPWLESPPGVDKIEHAVTFSALVILADWALRGALARIVSAAVLLGLTIEVLQRLMPTGRTGDLMDFLADLAGIGGGVLVVLSWRFVTARVARAH